MKKTIKVMAILLCAVTMVMLSACSKKDTYQRRIIGKWECVNSWYAVGNDPASISPNQYLYDEGDHDRIGQIWEFSNDGTMRMDNVLFSYIFTEDEDDILIGGLFTFHINELTNSSLKVWVDLFNSSDEDCIRMAEFQRVR